MKDDKGKVIQDIAAEKFRQYYINHGEQVDKIRGNLEERSDSKKYSFFKEGLMTSADSCDQLQEYAKFVIEDNDIELLKSKSVYHWLGLERRIGAYGYLNQRFDSEISVILSKQYFTRLIYKYASLEYPESFIPTQQINYTSTDYLATYRFEHYASEYQLLAMLGRTAAKGGQLRVKKDENFFVDCSKKLREQLDRFDLGNAKGTKLVGPLGFLRDAPMEEDFGLLDHPIVSCMANARNEDFKYDDIDIIGGGNYRPNIEKAREFYFEIDGLDDYYKASVGIDYLTWLKCLANISTFILSGGKEHVVNKLFGRAYAITERNSILSQDEEYPEFTPEDFDCFIEHALFTKEKQSKLDFLGRDWDFFILQISKDNLLIDVTLLNRYFLTTVSRALKAIDYFPGKRKIARGFVFEDQIYATLKKMRKKQIGKPNILIKLGNEIIAEVDIPIECKDLMLFLDCKSLIVNSDIDSGTFKSMQSRIEKVRSLLAARDVKAKKVAKNYHKLSNYKITQKLLGSHLICSENEWVPVDDDFFWWAEGIPRVTDITTFNDVVYPYLRKNLSLESLDFVYGLVTEEGGTKLLLS